MGKAAPAEAAAVVTTKGSKLVGLKVSQKGSKGSHEEVVRGDRHGAASGRQGV